MDGLEPNQFKECDFCDACEYGDQFGLEDIQEAVEVTVIALMTSEEW